MSASKEKKTRQEQTASGFTAPKTAREVQKQKETRRSNILYGVVAVIFVIVAIVTITWKTGIVQRKATAVTINGQNYTSAEVDYYYKNIYQNFVSNYSSYLSYFGLDTSKSLKDQECQMSQDGGSWYDYFMNQALTQMSSVYAMCDAAEADGFAWNDDTQAQFEQAIANLETSTQTYNSNYSASLSTEEYIKAIFGSIMTKDVYEAQLKKAILAQAYSDHYTDGLTYTDSDLTDAYNKDPNSYDVVDYESVKIDGSVQTTADAADSSAAASSSAAAEPTAEEKAAALENAKDLANSVYSSWKDGGSLSDLADENSDLAVYTDGSAAAYSDSVLMNWLFDTSREDGDSAVLPDEDNSAYYVVVFGSRYRYDYNTVDVRHILITPEQTSLAEGDDGYEEDVAQKKADAEKKAEDLLAQWKSGAATEDSFAELANANSEDTGSNTEGGLYEQVYKGQMVTEFNDWCFDADRQSGDTGIVYSESTGYHIIYFVGQDIPYWKVQVTNALKNDDYTTWYSGKTEDYTATQHSFGMSFIG